ncbi:glycerol-3-phosphate dehydrogenase/oxidase [Radiobacillus sp. PE A8.2]|uniref:glycerol-3-phosphate dehydrogenase/oxidase n=1 Tax=Radiobacillus sp. PE A8.2 TaxID=3380349 RepID=UPI00388F6373
MFFSNLFRDNIKQSLTANPLDVLVIGGGITGAGISMDAATRGLKVGLLEMQDFAAGTSSRSTKLIHGGLRYLKQLHIGVVAEVGKERAIVYENGPHVTTPEWMLLPFYKDGTFSPLQANVGLRTYDFLANVKKKERRKMLNAKQALQKEPLIKQDNLIGAGFYVEYRTDDARLTIEVLKKAIEYGANALNYIKVIGFIYKTDGQIEGVEVEDQLSGDQFQIFANKVVNAAGPWVDTIREMDGSKQGKTLHLTKGVHLVFDRERFPLQQAVYFDAPDGRLLFAIPRDGKTYVGTTDTSYEGDIAHPQVTVKDRDYVVDAINYLFPSLGIQADDVESSWAGLRPLIWEEGKSPGEISRKDELFLSKSGLMSVAGGKLTGYRKMAEETVDMIVKKLKDEVGILYSGSETKHIPISGGIVGGAAGFAEFQKEKLQDAINQGIGERDAKVLIQTYGTNVDKLFDHYLNLHNEALEAEIDPVVFAMLRYAIDDECIYTPSDFFIRRTAALYFDIAWVKKQQIKVIDYMAKLFKWDQEYVSFYKRELEVLLHEAVHPVED